MCMAIPSLVVQVGAGRAIVECYGVEREVSLALLEGEPVRGDYVLVRAGGFAVERLDPARAREVLACLAVLAGAPSPPSTP